MQIDKPDSICEFFLGLNKSRSVNFPRQRYTESGGVEATSHTVRGSKSASGCSKSLTQEESDRGNLNEQSKTPQGIFVIVIAAIATITRNCS